MINKKSTSIMVSESRQAPPNLAENPLPDHYTAWNSKREDLSDSIDVSMRCLKERGKVSLL